MPNHLHAILNIKKMNARRGPPHREGFSSPTFASVPTIVRTFKAAVTRHFRQHPSVGVIWQRDYFEHVIRDGKEYAEICRYIRENPLRWDLDENHPSSVAKQKPRLCRGGTIYRASTGS
jgi:putative transposase